MLAPHEISSCRNLVRRNSALDAESDTIHNYQSKIRATIHDSLSLCRIVFLLFQMLGDLFQLFAYLFVLSKDRLKLRMYCFRAEDALSEDQEKHQCQHSADSDKAHGPQNLFHKLVQTGIHRIVTLEYKKPQTSNCPKAIVLQ